MMSLDLQQLPTAQHHEYVNFYAFVEELKRLNALSPAHLSMAENRVYAVCAVCVDVLRRSKPPNAHGALLVFQFVHPFHLDIFAAAVCAVFLGVLLACERTTQHTMLNRVVNY